MAVTAKDIETATRILVNAGASRVYVFGSAAGDPSLARDLDLACSGLPADRFFDVYGEIAFALSVDIDLIDLDEDTPMARVLVKNARLLHGEV